MTNGDTETQEFNLNKKTDLFTYWKECMTQLRHLSSDVWNGVRFFLIVNGILFAAFFGFLRLNDFHSYTNSIVLFLAISGIFTSSIAFYILRKHRKSYVECLAKKTMVETKLGFYKHKFLSDNNNQKSLDASLPWSLGAVYRNKLEDDPDKFCKKHRWRWFSIAGMIRFTYLLCIMIHIVVAVFIVSIETKILSPPSWPTKDIQKVTQNDKLQQQIDDLKNQYGVLDKKLSQMQSNNDHNRQVD